MSKDARLRIEEPDSATAKIGGRLVRFFTSYLLAAILFFLMLLITLLGTLDQQYMDVHDAINKWFASFIVIHDLKFGDIAIPILLPGGYLLMTLLFFNLLIGGIVKIRKDWRRAPMIMTHFSILILLLGGAVTRHFADEGHTRVDEGSKSNYFTDHIKWDILVQKWENGERAGKALVLPFEQVKVLEGGSERIFTSEEHGIRLGVTDYKRNCMARPFWMATQTYKDKPRLFDGYFLEREENNFEAERNFPGATVRLLDDKGEETDAGPVWGRSWQPLVLRKGDETWGVRFERRKYMLPFEIALDEFVHEKHAGTEDPRAFKSRIRRIEDGKDARVIIEMNKPMRYNGYAVFQESFGQGLDLNDENITFSQFVVWRNPSDLWPIYACSLVGLSLLIHFVAKLTGFLNRASRKRARGATEGAKEKDKETETKQEAAKEAAQSA